MVSLSTKFLSDNVTVTAERILKPVTQFVRGNPLVSTAGVGLATAGITAGVVSAVRRRTKKKKRSPTKRKARKKTTKRRSKKSRGRRTPRTAGKGRDRSTKRIRYTKKGQPYVITRSGKARFIKKSSAKRSHKLKGGRY